jgi:hypothetical protein
MRMARMMRTVLALALTAPAVSGAAQLEVRHEPLSCVPRDRYARVSAQGMPAHEVVRAEIQFRTGPDAGWYTIAMAAEGAAWSALLPRAMTSLSAFQYRIVMTGRTLATATTAPVAVDVSSNECAVATQNALDSSIVVRIPPGAPIVPPVPPGFSPAGVVAAQQPEPRRSRKAAVLVAGAGAIGVTAAVLASSGTASTPVLDIPSFTFSGTLPNPGTVLSLSRGSLAVLVTMSREPARPLDLAWRLELRADPGGPVCLVMQDQFNDAQRPVGLVLTAPLSATGACGERFEVTVGRLTIDVAGTLVYDATQALPFRVEP